MLGGLACDAAERMLGSLSGLCSNPTPSKVFRLGIG